MVNIKNAQKIIGWMNDLELEWIAKKAYESKLILEIGCYQGRSTKCWADNLDGTIHCVDIWDINHYKIYKDHELDAFNKFKINLKNEIEAEKIIIHHMPFSEFKTELKFDLVFIDGDHAYQHVIHDIMKGIKLLKSKGIISGHDYGMSYAPGVTKAVNELLPNFNRTESIWWVNLEN